MSDRDGAPDPSNPSSDDVELSNRLRNLGKRLDGERAEREEERAPAEERRPGFAMALRLGADFVAGVVVGAVLGWGFDALFGTSPWGLIVLLLLGFAAGLVSVMRTAGLLAKREGLDNDGPAFRRFDDKG